MIDSSQVPSSQLIGAVVAASKWSVLESERSLVSQACTATSLRLYSCVRCAAAAGQLLSQDERNEWNAMAVEVKARGSD